MISRVLLALSIIGAQLVCAAACASNSKLVGTGGVTQIEGSAGGGLVPWATIAGLETSEEIGGSAFYTHLAPKDFALTSIGVAVGLHDRVELSTARQIFDLGDSAPGESIRMDIVGAKLRIAGDALFDHRAWMPQISVGAQYKINRDFESIPRSLGAHDDSGVDLYLAATKVFIAGLAGRSTLVNLTVRATESNQLGLLGFGGGAGYSLQPEFTLASFLTDKVIVGAEYRFKPDNLSAAREDDFADAFIAWLPRKTWALVAAYADLGAIANKKGQRGWYASLQFSL